MKTLKSKSKKPSNEIDESQSTSDQLFLIISLDIAKKFLNHLNNDHNLKLEIQNYLENTNLILKRPNLILNSFIKTDLFKQKYQIQSMDLINNNNNNNPNHFNIMEPKTSLWDSALINYFLGCIKWSTTKWIQEFYKKKTKKFNLINNKINNSMFQSYQLLIDDHYNDMNIEKLLCIIISFTTAYILLRHLQLWQLNNKYLYINNIEFSSIKNDNLINNNNTTTNNDKTTCLIGSIHFFKSLFQLSPTYVPNNNNNNSSHNSTTNNDNSSNTNNIENNLLNFEKQFSGYLSNLDLIAAELLIEYFSKNFLNKHYLLENVFGPYTAINQKLIKIPCPLYFDTLLETFETSSDSIWPAPLSEAIPLKFISKYPQLFPEKVTKWLKNFKPDDSSKEIEQQQQQQQQQQNDQPISSEKEIQITSTTNELKQDKLDPMFKYITSIDTLDYNELNAIIQVNPMELDNIIQKLLTELSSIKLSNQDYINKMKEKQIELGKQLIERAKIKMNEWNKQNK
uniref:CUE domain-containing protein n=1 Tax=Schistosoma mansoni TaxID=6183 RepID=A0A5K4FCG9_SCHMA